MDPVFVLTLADARERQQQLLGWAAAAGLGPEVFVPGVDLRQDRGVFQAPAAAEGMRRLRYGRPTLTPPEYGCLLGHRRIWERLLEGDQAAALVLEDDAIPTCGDWPAAVAALSRQLAASRLGDRRWVVHLAIDPHSRRTLALRPLQWQCPLSGAAPPALGLVDRRLGCLWTTTAYVISRAAARSLLETEAELPWVADDWEQRLRLGTLDALLASESPLFAADAASASQILQRSEPRAEPLNRPRRKLLSLAYRAGLLGRRC